MLAYTAYTWLLGNAPISTVTTYAYVNPVIALALGAAILSEEITPTVLLGATAIVAAVATVVREEARRSSEERSRGVGRASTGPATPARTRRRWWRRASPSG